MRINVGQFAPELGLARLAADFVVGLGFRVIFVSLTDCWQGVGASFVPVLCGGYHASLGLRVLGSRTPIGWFHVQQIIETMFFGIFVCPWT